MKKTSNNRPDLPLDNPQTLNSGLIVNVSRVSRLFFVEIPKHQSFPGSNVFNVPWPTNSILWHDEEMTDPRRLERTSALEMFTRNLEFFSFSIFFVGQRPKGVSVDGFPWLK